MGEITLFLNQLDEVFQTFKIPDQQPEAKFAMLNHNELKKLLIGSIIFELNQPVAILQILIMLFQQFIAQFDISDHKFEKNSLTDATKLSMKFLNPSQLS